jgi:hypothetical protein
VEIVSRRAADPGRATLESSTRHLPPALPHIVAACKRRRGD